MTVVNVQVVKYIHGIITPYSVDEYISWENRIVDLIGPHY